MNYQDPTTASLNPIVGDNDPMMAQTLSDADVQRAAAGFRMAQAVQVDTGLDANADDAAQAMQISDVTGDPPMQVADSLDEYRDDLRRQTAKSLVLNNPDLVEYVQSHPLASAVSNDDWGNLDKFTSESAGPAMRLLNGPLEKLADKVLTATESGAAQGFTSEGLWDGEPGVLTAENPRLNKLGAFGAAAATGWYGVLDLGYRALNAFGGAAASGAQALGEGIGGPAWGEEAGRFAQYELGRGDRPIHEFTGGLRPQEITEINQRATAAVVSHMFTSAGEEPPAWLDPSIDNVKAQVNAQYLAGIEKDLQNAMASTTRERSSELFQKLTQRLYSTSRMDINADAVLGLYGENTPHEADGLLGFVPGIADQLDEARATGAKISVPMADWMAKVDPAVAAKLRPDITVLPGGLSETEAAQGPTEPKAIVEAPLQVWRASTGTEPKFSIGDRKLQLQLAKTEPAEGQFGIEAHGFNILDENGQQVGDMSILPGKDKTLYVEWIGGKAGLWANSFGPGLIRDLKRQLKAQYPDYEYLTGHRVTGARGGVDEFGPMPVPKMRLDTDLSAMPKVPLEGKLTDLDRDHADTQTIFSDAYSRSPEHLSAIPPGFRDVRREGEVLQGSGDGSKPLPGWFNDVDNTISELSDRLGLDVKPKLWVGTASPGHFGVASNTGHIVIADHIDRASAVATALHEFGHVMEFDQFRKASPEVQQAIRSAWQRHSVVGKTVEQDRPLTSQKYDDAGRTQPATPEYHGNFHEWFAEQVSRWLTTTEEPTGVVEKFFKGIADLWREIYARVSGHAGLTPEVDEFMRGKWRPDAAEPAAPHPVLSALEGYEPNIEGLQNLQAASVGLPKDTFTKLSDLVRKRGQDDLERAMRQAEVEQKRRQSAEWRQNRNAMIPEVTQDYANRPDIAADRLLGKGDLFGQKVPGGVKLDSRKLSVKQRAALPEGYYEPGGVDPDQLAGVFGFGSGEEMVNAVGALQRLKVTADGKPIRWMDFDRKMIQAELDRRMEMKYGQLSQNVMEAARDQALSDSSINLLHEELLAKAQQLGVTVMSKAVMESTAKDIIGRMVLGKVSSFNLMSEMGRHARAAEAAGVAGNWPEAVMHMQRQTLSAMVAREARKVEKEMGVFERVAKRMAKRVQPSLPEEYTNWAHTILQQVGLPVKRGAEDLQRAIEAQASGGTLQEFVTYKNNWLQPVAVWDQLYDAGWKSKYDALQVREFRNVRDSIKSLMHVGRQELKAERAGQQVEFTNARGELIAAMQQFAERPQEGREGPVGGNMISHVLRTYLASTLQIETLFHRWDGFDKTGPWTQYVFRDLVHAVNQSDAWKKEFAKRLSALEDGVDLGKRIENNLIRAPEEYGGQFVPMNRGNLRAVLLNMGNDSNFNKLAKGWGIEHDMLRSWVLSKVTKADMDFAQGIWDLFSDAKERSDIMYRALSGVPAENIEPTPVATQFGTYRGGYYPVMYHEVYARIPKLQEVGLMQDGFEGATPPASYTKTRTGFVAPLTMELDRMPSRLSQIIHDTATRPAVLQAAKFLRDGKVQAAMTFHYGREYKDMMIPWLRNVANAANSAAGDPYRGASAFVRQNMVSSLIGLNPGTVLKHGPTALVLSMNEVGPARFFSAVRTMFSQSEAAGESNWQFALRHGLELQRRMRNWQETLYGATGELKPGSKLSPLRQWVMELGAKPVALSDMLSAVPTWLAAYGKSIEEGSTHGDAVFDADRAVRRAHGSSAVTSRPGIMNNVSPWLTTFYTFFNGIVNRQMETLWKAGEMLDAAKEGDWDRAKQFVGPVASGVATYWFWTAIVESWVSPQPSEPQDGWAKRSAKAMAYTAGASWVGVRDAVNLLLGGGSPDVGLASTALKTLYAPARDLKKRQPFSPANAEQLIRDAGGLVGIATGTPQQPFKDIGFAGGVSSGVEHPRGPWGWLVGARYGTVKGHSQTLQDYLAGRYNRR